MAGKAWRAEVWSAKACCVKERLGQDWQERRGERRHGGVEACCVKERLGQDWQDRQVALRSVKESLGLFRLGKAGKACQGLEWYV